MATAAKTLVATGCSSGLGLELIRQIIAQPTPWSITLAARSPSSVTAALSSAPKTDPATHVSIVPIDLRDLATVRTFAASTLSDLGDAKLDYLLLNAGAIGGERPSSEIKNKYSDGMTVNHISQHYLVHLLKQKLVESGTRIVFVSSGAVRNVPDPAVLDTDVLAGSETSKTDEWKHYAQTKFAGLLGAHWWRRELAGKCAVVAVSPGLIPGTGLGRNTNRALAHDLPDAKSVPVGAQSIYRAFERDDFPANPEQIFLTSWGEWWSTDVIGASLDQSLWDKWCPSKEEIEQGAGLA
jgi:NAD(P)-dependent dehydrogenase (short-subunit alcohol dehydrogenase family)